jgi:hypothetical protein
VTLVVHAGWPQWHCPYLVRFLSMVTLTLSTIVVSASCSKSTLVVLPVPIGLVPVVGDRSVGMPPLTSLTPVVCIAGSTGLLVLL